MDQTDNNVALEVNAIAWDDAALFSLYAPSLLWQLIFLLLSRYTLSELAAITSPCTIVQLTLSLYTATPGMYYKL